MTEMVLVEIQSGAVHHETHDGREQARGRVSKAEHKKMDSDDIGGQSQ
jgi:hypothetical protein